ncbi:hypothetical protein [Nonomuraea salmonea]|uniref:hypothetical protein n=1 Tax=Nonomuraea salmonea TaxID=46181 RepID=UPI0031E898BD
MARARECVERRLRVNRRLGDRLPEAVALLVLAEVLTAAGDFDAAVETVMRAMAEFDALGDGQGRAEAERLAHELQKRRELRR